MIQGIVMDLEHRLNKIEDKRKQKLISTIIKKDKWYNNIDFDTYISIMQDLGYNNDEAKEIYILYNTKKD